MIDGDVERDDRDFFRLKIHHFNACFVENVAFLVKSTIFDQKYYVFDLKYRSSDRKRFIFGQRYHVFDRKYTD